MENKQIYIDFILDELNKGKVQYKDVCSVFLRKFTLTRQTFDKYWKQANEQYKEQRRAINETKQEQITIEEIKAVKTLVLDKIGRMKIAESIAMEENNSNLDRLKALDYLSKIEGDFAPEKVENTHKVNIPPLTWVNDDGDKSE
jgi:hypothetical protein